MSLCATRIPRPRRRQWLLSSPDNDMFGDGQSVRFFFNDAFRSWRDGHAGFLGQRRLSALSPAPASRAGWADETNVTTLANLGEMRVLRRKP